MNEQAANLGAGARLGAARQARGLSLASLAAQLKVPEARLAALEAERWAELPDGPYARGLATAVCRALGVDAKDVLQLMPGAAPVALEKVAEGINRPLQLHTRPRLWASGPMLLLLSLLLAVAAAVALWPQGRSLPWMAGGQAPEADAEPVRLVEAPSVPSPPAVASAPASLAAPALSPQPSVAAPAALVASAPSSLAPSVAATANPGSGPPQAAQLSLLAREETWVSIADAKGTSLVARVLPAGERLQLDAPQAPLRIVLGNAPGAELSWRGQVQDLAPYQAVRVARLTLN